MTADYTYDATGEKTGVEYVKSASAWYSDTIVPTIHGQWAKQTSTFSKQVYSYDAAGRLTQVQNTPTGEGCTTRVYHYEQDGNRTALTTTQPNSKGECVFTGGTNETHWYDAADRLIDDGTVYDPAGDLAALPGADNSGGANLASTFYSSGKTDTQSEEGETTGYLLDPEQRPRETVLSGLANATITTHYAGPGYRPSWTVTEPGGEWVRDIYGIEGDVAALETNGSPTSLEIENLHGDVVATASPSTTATSLASTADTTEFGDPTGGRPPTQWWLGGFGLTTQEYSGTLLMGGRAYQPQLGRFLQPNPAPTTSEDLYSYLFNDPVNSRDPSGEAPLIPTNTAETAVAQPAGTPGTGAFAPFAAVQPTAVAGELTEQPTATPAAVSSPSILTPEALSQGEQW
jgi:RHS repeat-associated protein